MENNQITIQPEESYKVIRKSVLTAQSKVYTVVNCAIVHTVETQANSKYFSSNNRVSGIWIPFLLQAIITPFNTNLVLNLLAQKRHSILYLQSE